MKNLLLPAMTAAILSTLGSFSSSAVAQNAHGANATKFKIAVVDVGYIFKNHQGFRAQMDGMKAEMEAIEQKLKTQRDAIAQKEAQRNDFKPNTPDYKALDEEVARDKADFNIEMSRLRKDFLEREAQVYYKTYLEVDEAVRYHAQRHDIGLVLRFNGENPDPTRREEILGLINRPIVFQNNIDITPDILAILNRSQRTATPTDTQIPSPQRR